jgi:hypothetical protein
VSELSSFCPASSAYMIGVGAGTYLRTGDAEALVAVQVSSAMGFVKAMGVNGLSAGNVFMSVPYDADGRSMLVNESQIPLPFPRHKGSVPQRSKDGCHK